MSTTHDDVTGQHPGAAFGIPEGAEGEEVVDAVFGDARPSEGLEALRAELAAQAEGRIAGIEGIDPALMPYLEAAQEEDSLVGPDGSLTLAQVREAGISQAEREAAQEEEDLQALRELVAHNMLGSTGSGDLDQLDALLAEVDEDDSDDWDQWDQWEPVLPQADDPTDLGEELASEIEQHQADLRAAAHGVEVSARMRQVEAEILSRAPEHKVQPSLERVEAVLDIIGHPERTYTVVHITGTNGKTSTARMTERLLAATGMRTGRFTSPHLATIRERISLDGEPISEEGFIAAWEDVAPYVAMVDERSQASGGPRMSFFEVLTVMAFAAFADYPVDVAVIEVGMGGTWDSTNVVDSAVEVITPIGRDHQAWLGDTIEQIASNKAGIIKDGATLITSTQPRQAQEVIAEAAAAHAVVWRRELGTQEDPDATDAGVLQVVDRTLAVGGQMVTLKTAAATYEDVFIPLHGQYQAHNALLALAAAEAVFAGRALPARVVQDGFAAATSPGRLEVLRSSPTVIVDAGHNPHGVSALVPAVQEAFGFQHLVAVVGAMADKDVEGILSVLEPATDAVVVVPMDSPRAMEVEDLAAVAREVYGEDRVIVAEDLGSGVEQAVALSEGFDAPMTASGVLIVGSVVLAAEARALFHRA
ncbi:MAG: folylpolyglutamate synthase/dihydrofolate synthase family protein [Actinomyces urogenitalis]|uniref:tetrahydrofolate synthase n=1 Tax=Actinomyces urogenitalis TaxID=103621 RepID=A0A2I1KTU6_9ACTO|nr:folylpolyglutamate synthase/dihydrofolate synthase family protein [Actinomyces urogenitalis]MDK8236874.1 folylpolyglutamate synthase/dihydrofolate synthase family protein [Actinomyces urogenitalis]MDU0971895.1 folylpolyglutamate synthase/dihydrofolate synthase family protein [Actinomyces urogenitalis]PKY99041.1 tetrahydrofolate synthase [Actinomyces urogenitalis]WOO95048.1 folylpolyglutamate synthase/dihydrofolate synthase family protein [Actinomyces urogenitalis]